MKGFFDGLKNAVESLSDSEYRKSLFAELKEGVAGDVKELLAVKQEAAINGVCPLCKKETGFRECSFTENVTTVGKFVAGSAGQFMSSSVLGKAESVAKIVGTGDGRKFPSYICLGCQGRVMQCSGCNEIAPYTDLSDSHVCGQTSVAPETSASAPRDRLDDLISKLERLGTLKERGLLSADEFEIQKKRLLG